MEQTKIGCGKDYPPRMPGCVCGVTRYIVAGKEPQIWICDECRKK